MTEQTLEVHFIHPRTSKRLVADLSPQCTGHDALQALFTPQADGTPFLTQAGGQTYALSLERTDTAITPNMTFFEAGVMDRDIINIHPNVIGAGTSDYVKKNESGRSAPATRANMDRNGSVGAKHSAGKGRRNG